MAGPIFDCLFGAMPNGEVSFLAILYQETGELQAYHERVRKTPSD